VLGDEPRRYPVLDLGGGTGYAALQLATLLPSAEIVTVERSAAMRCVLNARLTANESARHRVTVVAGDLFRVALPPVWSAAVGYHFVCQLDPPDRERLWRLLRRRLAPGGVAVLDRCFGPKSAEPVPRRLMAEASAGANTYQQWFEAEPSGPDSLCSTSTYLTLRDGAVVAELSARRTQFVVTQAQVLAEAAAAGLTHRLVSDLIVLTRPPAAAS
jgi:predicted O-methyltransferase YrrM